MRMRKEASPSPVLRSEASREAHGSGVRSRSRWTVRYRNHLAGPLLIVLVAALVWIGWKAEPFAGVPRGGEPFATVRAKAVPARPKVQVSAGTSEMMGGTNTSKPVIRWPLEALEEKYPSAGEFYRRGFFQFMPPVLLERWPAVDNNTCFYALPGTNASSYEASLTDWQRRIPSFVLIGAQKGGTTSLAYYLYNHPSIQYLPQKELDFFDQELDHNPEASGGHLALGGVQASATLLRFQAQTVGSIFSLDKFKADPDLRVLDATPQYLFLSDRVPRRLFCAAPWVKLMCLLRNPVDRAFSQYLMQVKRDRKHPATRRGFLTFEEYIELDLQVLEETGVLPALRDGDEDTLAKAWSIYTKLGVNSPVGRGLYHLQLSQWIAAMEEAGKPRSDLWVIPSERLFQDPKAIHAQALAFLGLDAQPLDKYHKIHAGDYGPGDALQIDPSTRANLEAFFRPHNAMLVEILGDEWEGIWETHSQSET